MILHMALFRWNEDVQPDDVAAVEAELAAFRPKVPQILDYHFGADLGLRDGNGDFAVLALVATPDDLHAYLDDPAHKELTARVLAPRIASRLALQVNLDVPIGAGILPGS
ncbi:MAG TPA: Dabb family protein [Acidimicrobiales bacterium]|nr:Dabb family protein [Acidimicrobiales bacterium]